MNLQEKHDQRVLYLYKNMVKSNTLTIEQSDLVQNIQFVDQLPINTLKVYYSYDIRFDRVPSKITSLQFTNCPKTNFQGFEQMKQLKILTLNYNSLIKINFLSVLVNLTYLNISYNDIENVSPIENLIELKQIKLDFNKISKMTRVSMSESKSDSVWYIFCDRFGFPFQLQTTFPKIFWKFYQIFSFLM
ncbi:Conserved_hypothetical protein [Hexamita inflata]|uniref:Leucine rich repeat protein n=1 Tax=Hexamita inflata TaxID=28002 RepID=A0ABP1GDM1_9EUKA